MKTIDVIRSGSLSDIIGPSGTMKRIIKNLQYFKDRGYYINIYTHDSIIYKRPNFIPDKNLNGRLKSKPFYRRLLTKISKKARLRAKYNVFLANFYLRKDENNQKRLIKYYLSLNRKPDILVFHSEAETFWYLNLCKIKDHRIVTFLHSDGTGKMALSYFPCIKDKKGERHLVRMLKEASEGSDKLVFISQIARDTYIKNHQEYPIDKIGLAVNGIEDFSDKEKDFIKTITSRYSNFKYRLCCTGTINRRKGQWRVLEALSEISKEKLKDIHVSFIGDGPQKEELYDYSMKHGLNNNVTFEGSVDNSEVYKYLMENNIYILMSDNEGLPISIIEAMRAGLPIISTKVAGIPETVDENGILLDLDNNSLYTILNNLDMYDWDNMGALSREKFEKDFQFARMAKDYCDIMDSLVSES